MKDYNRNPERSGRVATKSPEKKKKRKGTRDIPHQLYTHNADDYDIIADTGTGCESDPEEDTDDDEDLYLYIKTIAQHSKCYYWFVDFGISAHMTDKSEYFVGDRK